MNDGNQPADLPLPEATPDAAARSDAIDAIARLLEYEPPMPFRDLAVSIHDAAAPALRDQGAAAERAACVREIFEHTETMAPLIGAAYRDAARLLLRGHPGLADLLAGDAP